MASSVDSSLPLLKPHFAPDGSHPESSNHKLLINTLNLQSHPEGGYFLETDRDTSRVPNPFALSSSAHSPSDALVQSRSASTTIFYYLTPKSPLGHFHRNRARTVHTLHKGRGRYVIVHADEVASSTCPGGYGDGEEAESTPWTGKARVETFVVGQDVARGEKLQWIAEGGKYKASYLLPDEEGGEESEEGLLISETVVPGFDFSDHDFMGRERFEMLLKPEQQRELEWMLRKEQ